MPDHLAWVGGDNFSPDCLRELERKICFSRCSRASNHDHTLLPTPKSRFLSLGRQKKVRPLSLSFTLQLILNGILFGFKNQEILSKPASLMISITSSLIEKRTRAPFFCFSFFAPASTNAIPRYWDNRCAKNRDTQKVLFIDERIDFALEDRSCCSI